MKHGLLTLDKPLRRGTLDLPGCASSVEEREDGSWEIQVQRKCKRNSRPGRPDGVHAWAEDEGMRDKLLLAIARVFGEPE